MALAREFFGPLGERTEPIMSRYSAAELAVIESFMAGTAEVMAAYREELQAASHPASEGGGNPGA